MVQKTLAPTNGAAHVSSPLQAAPPIAPSGRAPISLSEFRANSRPITITWLDQEIEVRYRPCAMDATHYERIRAADDDTPYSDWVVMYALEVVDSIPSLCNDDGSPLVINEETLRQLPSQLLSNIVDEVRADLSPKAPPKDEDSSGS